MLPLKSWSLPPTIAIGQELRRDFRQKPERTSMEWVDRVYGKVTIEDRRILALVDCPTFQRLKGVRQAGPSALAFPFKNVTRFEHSLGVFELLRRLGACEREQVAGLLHDISHTAFSHAVDFVYSSEEQAHHEELKPLMLERPDIESGLRTLAYKPTMFFDDSIYPLLEQPIPGLCADRIDYFLRDGLVCGVVGREAADRILSHLQVVESRIVFRGAFVAREAASLFAAMNRDWWASATEGYIYNEFADILREGLRLKVIDDDDLMSEDELVLAKLDASRDPLITEKLRMIREYRPEFVQDYRARVIPKNRWLDPAVQIHGKVRRLSAWEGRELAG
jgi:uncharacterized protein